MDEGVCGGSARHILMTLASVGDFGQGLAAGMSVIMGPWLKRLQTKNKCRLHAGPMAPTRIGKMRGASSCASVAHCCTRRSLAVLMVPSAEWRRLVCQVPAMDDPHVGALFEPRAIGAGTILILALRAVGTKRNLFLFADAGNKISFSIGSCAREVTSDGKPTRESPNHSSSGDDAPIRGRLRLQWHSCP